MNNLDNFLHSGDNANLSIEDVYKAVMYSSPDGISIIDLEGNLVALSSSGLKMLHIPNSTNILGKNIFDLVQASDKPIVIEKLTSLIKGRIPERVEISIIRPNQTSFFADIKGEIVLDAQGEPSHIVLIVRDISYLKEQDKNLNIQNSKLNAILNAVPDLMFVIDRNGIYQEVIASNLSLLPLDPSEIIGRNISEFFYPEETTNHLYNINECLVNKKLTTYEYSLEMNGLRTFWEARLTPMQDDKVLSFVRDITEKKLIEAEIFNLNANLEKKINERTEQLEALNHTLSEQIAVRKETSKLLEQNNLNFQTFFNAVEDYLIVLDIQKKIIHANETAINRLGYSELELIGMDFEAIHYEDRIPGVHCCLDEVIAGSKSSCNVPLVTKEKEYIPIESSIKRGEWNGNPVIFIAAKDISELRFSEEKFAKAFQSNAALIAILDQNSQRIMDVNNSFTKRLGYERENILWKIPTELNILDDFSTLADIRAELEKTGSCRDYEIEINTSDGSKVPVLFSADLIFIGKQKCVITMMIDISERKEFENEIMRNKVDAEKANQAKSEFLSRMSHELRTPLNSILGFAQLMEMTEMTDLQKKGVTHILESGKHLLDLINEVLDIAKIEAGKYDINAVPLQLNQVIQELTDSIHPLAAKNNITFVVEDLSEVKILADNKFIRQILLNLFSNAVKYNKPDGFVWISSKIIEKAENARKMCRILVKDSGIGIPEEKIDKIFTPFERIGADNLKIEGTGLGLAVVEKLVHAMNGSIGAESVLNEGTTFWIELPLAE